MTSPLSRPPWHHLLAPLPPDSMPQRRPVAPPEVLAGPDGWAIAGWEQLVLCLSAGTFGLRTVLVVLDASGTPISASDGILHSMDPSGAPALDGDGPALIHQDSIGGRFETDGSFGGTRWHTEAVVSGRDEEPRWESTRMEPSADDVAALRLLVAEIMRRGALNPP